MIPTLLLISLVISLKSVIAAPNIPSLPTGWSYVGCLYEGNDNGHLLSSDYDQSPNQNIRACVDTCISKGNIYAGLQNSDQCTCGNTLKFSQPASESFCTSPCGGASDQPCGGWIDYMTLLKYTEPTPPPPPKPVPVQVTTTSSTPPIAVPTPTSARTTAVADAPTPVNPPISPESSSTRPTPLSSNTSPSSSSSSVLGSLPISGSLSGSIPLSSSSNSSTVQLIITQYLPKPSNTLPTAAQFSGSGLNTNSGSAQQPLPTPNQRFQNATIIRPGVGDDAKPRFRDQSNLIVFGTYLSDGSRAVHRSGRMSGFWSGGIALLGLGIFWV